MLSKFFAPLAIKIFAGTTVALLIAIGAMTIAIHGKNSTIEKRDLEIKAVTAERDRFQAALKFYVDDGQIRLDRGQQALKEHEPVSQQLKRDADRIRQAPVAKDGCATPKEVMEAAL